MPRASRIRDLGISDFPTRSEERLQPEPIDWEDWALVRQTNGTTLAGYATVTGKLISVRIPKIPSRRVVLGPHAVEPALARDPIGALQLPEHQSPTHLLASSQVYLIERISEQKAREYAAVIFCPPVGRLDQLKSFSQNRASG